jgi:hypothetical protein
MNLELIETERGYFTVIIGARFADMLGRDEALGVIAAFLFNPEKMPPYLMTYERWVKQAQAWRSSSRWEEPVALLEMRKSSATIGTAPGGAVLRGTGIFPGGGTLPQQTQRRPHFTGERVRMPDVFRKVNP